MRALLTCVSVSSHLLPIVPLAMALRSAGHEVLLAGQPDLIRAAGSTGLCTVTVGSETGEQRRRTRLAQVARDHASSSGQRWQPTWDQLAQRWQERVSDVVHDYLAVGKRWRPDLIVSDPLEFSSLIVGGLLGIPTVVHRWGAETLSTEAREPARRALADICAQLGLPNGLPAAALVLDPSPPTFQFPQAAAAQPVRFVPFNGVGAVPDWAGRRSARHRVCVSLGSMPAALGGRAVLDTVIPALDSLGDVETVVLGAGDLAGPWPASVRLVEEVPLNLFANTCDLIAHHGGSGSGLTAVAFGLPQLVLAQFNPALTMHADRVTACGVGISLTGDQQSEPAAVRAAARELLTDAGYRERTEQLRAQMLRQPTPAALVGRLERLAAVGAVG